MNPVFVTLRREPAVGVASAALVLLFSIWILTTPNLTVLSFTITMAQKVPLTLVAAGQAIAIMSKGIDLSVGAVLTMSNVVIAAGTAVTEHSTILWIAAALGVGLLAGAVNGLCVALLELPPLIVTLATQSILFGAALYILPRPGGVVETWMVDAPLLLIGPVPLVLIVMVLVPAMLWYPLRRGRFGLALLSSGADPGAAFASGVRVEPTIVMAYMLSSLFSAIAGILVTMNSGSGDATIGTSYTMNAIAACVVGGVALQGGRGTVSGAIAGALLISFITNLLFSMGVNAYWQYVITGIILVLAISVPLIGKLIRRGGEKS